MDPPLTGLAGSLGGGRAGRAPSTQFGALRTAARACP